MRRIRKTKFGYPIWPKYRECFGFLMVISTNNRRDRSVGCLKTGQMTSGVERAQTGCGPLHGTAGTSAGMAREKHQQQRPRGESTEAEHWGGPIPSSEKGWPSFLSLIINAALSSYSCHASVRSKSRLPIGVFAQILPGCRRRFASGCDSVRSGAGLSGRIAQKSNLRRYHVLYRGHEKRPQGTTRGTDRRPLRAIPRCWGELQPIVVDSAGPRSNRWANRADLFRTARLSWLQNLRRPGVHCRLTSSSLRNGSSLSMTNVSISPNHALWRLSFTRMTWLSVLIGPNGWRIAIRSQRTTTIRPIGMSNERSTTACRDLLAPLNGYRVVRLKHGARDLANVQRRIVCCRILQPSVTIELRADEHGAGCGAIRASGGGPRSSRAGLWLVHRGLG
jgi:hypothetical protein